MSKHTEGPYVIATLTEADDMEADIFEEGTIGVYAKSDLDNADECPAALCYMNDNWGEFRETAKLFAAAPALLEALQAVVRVADRKTVEFDMARAAIASATGTTGEGA